MLIIGCDPGLTGAISLLSADRRALLDCQDLPTCDNGTASGSMKRWLDAEAFSRLLQGWSDRHDFAREGVTVFIERPIPMPSLPAQTIASQFDTFGVLRAQLARRGVMHYVNPRDWKKSFGLSTEKAASREVCLRLYNSAPVARVKDHNRAESILIGHFGMRGLE
ncbi:hypothetical protein C7T35_01325 [Variovorax sp. WS11]|uniref:hypothetical protein n=1 Tax=Variovorax sp. WS11 TaxID=1105204 RepID=UPI000D0E1FE5|nr:hypothetical protein [Variovorax sp. WS11]NDZ11506.1 hypothetical protein [Variovorax sp. WS11]PSL86638.1 hypothetical protein C7T35_01325 [Variovorax sp. WS11]